MTEFPAFLILKCQQNLELSSKSTYRADLNRKKELYAQVLGVSEYFIYDPDHQYLNPPLQGYRLIDEHYVPIPTVDSRLASVGLGLELGFKADGELGLFNPQKKEWLLTPDQQVEARQQAEAELAQLRVELEQLRAQRTNHQ